MLSERWATQRRMGSVRIGEERHGNETPHAYIVAKYDNLESWRKTQVWWWRYMAKKISAKTMNLMIFWPERAWEAGIGEVSKMWYQRRKTSISHTKKEPTYKRHQFSPTKYKSPDATAPFNICAFEARLELWRGTVSDVSRYTLCNESNLHVALPQGYAATHRKEYIGDWLFERAKL